MKPALPLALLLLAALAGNAPAQDFARPQPAQRPAADSPAAEFEPSELARLVRLTRQSPRDYLELGEEILDRPDSPARVEMARQLLARALEYARQRPDEKRTAASAAFALASVAPRENDRRWLRAVAAILGPDMNSPAARADADRPNRSADARASDLLTRLRAGDGIEAREILEDRAVREVLRRHEAELSAGGTMSLQDLDSEAKKWPCTECANTGIIAPLKGQHTPARICPVCAGQPGMRLKPHDLAAQFHLQRRLLSDTPEGWGSLAAGDGAPPAHDPDPANVAPALGVDPRLSIWRDGKWRTPDDEEGPTEQPQPKPAAPTVAPPKEKRPMPEIPAPAPAPATPAAPVSNIVSAKPGITFEEFAKVDLRVARIVKAEFHPSADRLFKLQLDDGSGTPRQICAGIRGHYTPEELTGQTIIIVANLAPRVIRGEESRGMLLAASDAPKDAGADAQRRVVILTPKSDIAPGSIVS